MNRAFEEVIASLKTQLDQAERHAANLKKARDDLYAELIVERDRFRSAQFDAAKQNQLRADLEFVTVPALQAELARLEELTKNARQIYGPAGWAAVSTLVDKSNALQAEVARLAADRERLIGFVKDCAVTPEPKDYIDARGIVQMMVGTALWLLEETKHRPVPSVLSEKKNGLE